MTDHPEPLPPAQPTMTTGIARGMHQLEDLENRVPQPSEAERAYATEPLFSKKVLLGWAAAAFAVWMVFQIVVPVIKETVRAAVVESVAEPGSNAATKQVIRTRNGLTITRTDKGVTIQRETPGAASAAPVVIPTPEAPKEPAAAPPAQPVPPVSGKK